MVYQANSGKYFVNDKYCLQMPFGKFKIYRVAENTKFATLFYTTICLKKSSLVVLYRFKKQQTKR